MAKKKEKVAVAMSGGVDSSVTAFLLLKQGYEVVGLHMRLGVNNNAEEAARKVCQKLKIKFYPVNLERHFQKNVIKYFLDSYKAGLTPNPCVNCNRLIKFGELLDRAREIGADYLATGHYARLGRECPNSKFQIPIKLLKPKDEKKDQTYFLYTLTQDQLKRILFPLGEYTKEEIKKIAKKNKLPNIKSESQDVCFLDDNHNIFLKENLKMKKGKVVMGGKVVGKHNGLPLYTIGQRRGVELGGAGPYYVVGMDYKKNILYVSNDREDPRLYADELIAKNVNWVLGEEPKMPFNCEAVIRYRHKPEKVKSQKSKVKSQYIIKFEKPQRAITPGQSVVFYKGNEVIGGGVIN